MLTKNLISSASTMSVITSDSSLSSDEEDLHQQTKAICGECGKELDNNWKCSVCRRECSICNRSLTNDPDEYCERCFKKCSIHGLYCKTKTTIQCPQCVKQ